MGLFKKKVDNDKAKIIVCDNNFMEELQLLFLFLPDAGSKDYFGPHTPGFINIPYNDLNALEKFY